MQKRDLAKTIEFVVSEVFRLAELYQKDWKAAVDQLEISMGMPSDRSEFPCRAERYYRTGKEAERQLYEAIAERVESDRDLVGRISPQNVFEQVRILIAQRCIEQRQTVTTESAAAIFRTALEWAGEKAIHRTYFFPVFAISNIDQSEYSIAGVTFTRTKVFFERHREEWESSIKAEIDNVPEDFRSPDITQNTKRIYSWAEQYYRKFPSVAAVSIRLAELELGRTAARTVLESVFNLQRMFVTSTRGQFVGLAEESLYPISQWFIERDATGNFKASGRSTQAEPFFEGNAIRSMREKMPQLRFFEYILQNQARWAPLTKIEKRLLNGLTWFGDAWKERSSVAKLVKFAVALETLLMTGAREAITETLSERVALLCGGDVKEREELYAETREVYRARSKAVHGAMKADSANLYRINATAEKLCMFALFECASLFPLFIGSGRESEALTEFFKVAKLAGLEEAAARIGAKICPTRA